MRTLGPLLLLLGACTSEGLIVEVVPSDVPVDHVRLYVGTGDPSMPPTLGPAGVAPLPGATYWLRDPGNEVDESAIAAGDTLRFRFDGATNGLSSVIAVGFSNGQPVATASAFDVKSGTNEVNIYKLALTAPLTSFDAGGGNALALWSDPSVTDPYQAQCVGVSTPNGPRFIVTPGDPDCDGLSVDRPGDNECNEYEYMSDRQPKRDELSCLHANTAPASCWLGGPACTDGIPKDALSCVQSSYCAPTTLCDSCDRTSLGCLATPSVGTWSESAIRCTLSGTVSGNSVQLCPNHIVVPPLPVLGTTCTDVAIGDGTAPFGASLKIGTAQFDLQLASACAITIQPQGTTTLGAHAALLAADGPNASGVGVPIIFDVVGGTCNTEPVMCSPADPASPEWAACGSVAPRCGSPGAIRDSFSSGGIGNQWRTVPDSGSGVMISSNALVLSPKSTPNIGLSAKHTVNLVGSSVEVVVLPETAFLATPARAMLRLAAELPGGTGVNNAVVMSVSGTTMTAAIYDNGTVSTLSLGTWDANQRKHWRIAESGGMLSFSTSPDGVTWNTPGLAVAPSFLRTVRIELLAGDGVTTTGTVSFDDVNANLPSVPWCQADSFQDLFARTGTFPGFDWLNSLAGNGAGCQIGVANGAYIKSSSANTDCYFGTSPAFDLSGSSATVDIATLTNLDASLTVHFDAVADGGQRMGLSSSGGSMCVTTMSGTLCTTPVGGPPRFWRFKDTGGALGVQTSFDGSTWSAAVSDPTIPMTALELRLRATTATSGPLSTTQVQFNRYN